MYRYLLVLSLALGLAACRPEDDTDATAAPDNAPTEAVNPAATSGLAETGEEIPAVEGFPPQTNAAVVQPSERYEDMSRLSNLLDYHLVGLEQSAFGQIRDLVINTCETYLIYMVVEPDPSLGVDSGQRLLIPYEAVTINNGIVDGDAQTIALHLAPADLAGAPAFADPLPLFPLDWEDGVRTFWGEQVRIGKLHTGCQAGGVSPENAIHKIAYAQELLSAEIKDGNGNLLGTVREAILEPATGKLSFYLVELADGSLALVPIGRTNIPEEALEPGATIELVLLAETSQLEGAPRLSNADEATSADAQNSARAHWGQ